MTRSQRDTEVLVTKTRAREIVGFAGSGPIFESSDRFCPDQEAKKSVHKNSLFRSKFFRSNS